MAMFLEEAGIPTVPINTHVFARLARATASAYGMPTMRNVYVPQPVVGRTPDELRAYIEGVDPVSKRPFMQEVVEALTKPLSEEDFKGLTYERAFPRLLPADTPDNLRALFIENRWTDMLPIVLPTEERVAAMLKGTSLPANRIVGRMRPTAFREFWEFDVEKVAVNAVMAGALPISMPPTTWVSSASCRSR